MSYKLINASAHDTGLPAKSVHCVVTSPPYFGLRSYAGEQDVEWPEVQYAPMAGLPMILIPGCHQNCQHEWTTTVIESKHKDDGIKGSTLGGGKATQAQSQREPITQGTCIHCGGMRCGLGAEPTPEAFIGHLILVMREMWRVLRDDGTAWVNLGDSYNGSGGAGGDYGIGGIKEGQPKYPGRKISALKPKDLMMIPARFALAAQADGWYLRSDIIWHKPNPMPESVTDRCTKAHEYIYMLAKSEKYYFDADAIKEPAQDWGTRDRTNMRGGTTDPKLKHHGLENGNSAATGRNKRSVWKIATSPFAGAHFATFPIELPLTCIKAGTSEHGVCAKCQAPYERVTEKENSTWEMRKKAGATIGAHAHDSNNQPEQSRR
jgi:DNA modification methylase